MTMLNKYRLFQRANGVFYRQDNESGKQWSLRTKDRRAAEKLLHVQNEAHRLPTLNVTMARAYLSAHDAKLSTRTWSAVMREIGTHGIASSQERCAREPSARKRSQAPCPDNRRGPALNRSQQRTLSRPLSSSFARSGLRFGLAGLADPCQAGLAQDPRQAPPVILLFFL
jgi:hypothetical protein